MKNIQYYLSCLVLFIVHAVSFAQTKEIKGTVIDKITLQAIEGVVVSDLNNTSIVVTNDEGTFSIVIDANDELLQFNHIAYQAVQEKVSDDAPIALLPITNELEEILIFNQPLYTVFSDAFSNLQNTVQTGDLYETYFREFNTVDNQKVNVADGLVDLYVSTPGKNALVEVKENRAFITRSDIDEDDFKESMNVMGIGDLRDVLNNVISQNKLLGIFKKTDTYEFVSKLQTKADGTPTIVVTFEPLPTLTKKKKKEVFSQGYVIFNEEKTKVLEYKVTLWDKLKDEPVTLSFLFGLAKLTPRDMESRVIFTDKFGSSAISYGQLYFDFDLQLKAIKKGQANVKVNREFVVDKLHRNVAIPKQKSFKGTSLFAEETNYTTEYWKGRNLRPLTSKEQATLEALEAKANE